MIIKLGYACICESLEGVTTSSSYTYSNYLKEKDLDKLDRIIKSNLDDLEKIISFNICNNIHFYRLSSKIIPLATKDDVLFDYIDKYMNYYNRIGNLINNNNLRVDFHPDQFCVLNSVKKDVVNNSIEILKYHYKLLESLKIDNKILVLHIGSNTFGKDNSLKRFINNFLSLPKYLQGVIAIENDDKVFNIEDCLYLNSILNIPIVLDYHHHLCNHNNLDIDFNRVFKTWKNINPKVHFSTSKSSQKKEIRSHNDYINADDFISFLDKIKNLDFNIDIMIEAKKKDEALFRLIRNLKYKTDYKFMDETTFYLQ